MHASNRRLAALAQSVAPHRAAAQLPSTRLPLHSRLSSSLAQSAPENKATRRGPLVSPQWVAERLLESSNKPLFVLDATWLLGKEAGAGGSEFIKERLPNAHYFDIDECAIPKEKCSNLPHMLPDISSFAEYAGSLGLRNTDDVVVYDRSGEFVASARVWWTLLTYAHKGKVYVLDGGLPAWKGEMLPTVSGPPVSSPRVVDYELPAPDVAQDAWRTFYRSKSDVQSEIANGVQVIDARPAQRFRCEVDEPRKGVRRGTIPSSKNLPHQSILTEKGRAPGGNLYYSFVDDETLVAKLRAAGVDWTSPVISSCGSGVTASVVVLGLRTLGHDKVSVYDGSWAEWGAIPNAEQSNS